MKETSQINQTIQTRPIRQIGVFHSVLGLTYKDFAGIALSPQLRGPRLWGLQKTSKEPMKLQRRIVKALRGTLFNKGGIFMAHVRGYGLLSSLLFVGVLMAPVPSEASESTVKISGSSPIQLYGGGICSTADKAAGYTSCWALLPSPTSPPMTVNSVTYANVSSSNPARLLIADTTGAGNSLDLLTLTGVTFQSTNNATGGGGAVNFDVEYSNNFNDAPNIGPSVLSAQRIGGYFVASDGSVYKNQLSESLSGIFPTGLSDLGAVSTGVIGNTTATASFNLVGTQPYTQTACAGPCSPIITKRMLIHIENGRDTVYVINSGHVVIGNCSAPPPPADVPNGPPTQLPVGASCSGTAGKITGKLNSLSAGDNASTPPGTPSFVACVDDPETEVDECFVNLGED